MLYFLPILALVLDYIFKDPKNLPHPVMLIGRMAKKLKPRASEFAQRGPICVPGIGEYSAGRIAGIIALGIILISTTLTVFLLTRLPFLGIIFAVYFAYAGLALGSLLREGELTRRAIQGGGIEEARALTASLVSRDTSGMNKDQLYTTLAETLGENFNDALVAPFFWLILGGPVFGPALLWFYKASSTMDSLWGYKNEEYKDIGFASARLDDFMAFIPARISVLLLYLGSLFIAVSGKWPGLAVIAQNAKKMDSPNAGWPMSAASWLHSANMGGKLVYFGNEVDKPVLGPMHAGGFDGEETSTPQKPLSHGLFIHWNDEKIRALITHLRVSGVCAGALGLLFSVLYCIL